MELDDFKKMVHDLTKGEYAERVKIEGTRKVRMETNQISIKWVIGGMTGGNCWGDHADQAVNAEDEPDFEALNQILEHVCPNISYLMYRKLEKLIETDHETDHEYYGNYRDYAIRKISLEKLHGFLTENGLFNDFDNTHSGTPGVR